MTLLDIIIIGVLLLFMYMGYRRGLIRTVFNLVSFALAIILSVYLFPIVANWLRGTALFTGLKDYIIRTMGLEDAVQTHSAELISTLPIPDILRRNLIENNNPNMFELLNVQTIEEYIASYFAGLAINIISIILVFIAVRLILGLISGVLNIVGKLPIIKQFNHGGGLLLGILQGVIVVWVGLTIINLFFLDPTAPGLQVMLDESLVAGWFYENNPIMHMIASISI
ncbi:MAG: CvpA family protein [Defluviitaleaceae bacterium]|nr:CvpA family protein [Defluviitaleaceae bacterium]